MSENKDVQSNNVKPCIYIKYRAFSPLKENLKYFKSLSIYSTQQIDNETKTATNEEMTQKVLAGMNTTVNKQRSKKKRWLSFSFLILNIAILVGILWYQFSHSEDNVSFEQLFFSELNWWWMLGALALFLLAQVFDSMRIWILIKRSTGQNRPWLSLKATITQRFYDSITPMATGGQPFQIFYLNKRGLSASTATSVPLAKYIFSQAFFVIFAFIVILLNTSNIISLEISPVIITMCWIGLGLNALLILSIVLLSVSKKVAPSIAIGLLKLCKKLHFIKDYRRTYAKIMHVVREYITTSRKFFSTPWVFVGELLFSLMQNVTYFTIPFCIYTAICGFHPEMWFQILAFMVACDLTAGFMPLPGGSGVAELSSKAVFTNLFKAVGVSTGLGVWAMLFWRIFSYYGFLLEGVLLMLYDYVIGNKKIERTLEKLRSK